MDQVAAQKAGNQTPLPSLELGIAPVTTGVDTNVGYTRVYGSHIAWSGPTSPLAREINPRLVYERLLRATKPQPNSAKDDCCCSTACWTTPSSCARSSARRTGSGSTSISPSCARSKSASAAPARSVRPTGSRAPGSIRRRPPEELPKQHAEHVRLMLDMIALAFQTDTTRIARSCSATRSATRISRFVEGVTGRTIRISHHKNDADKLRQYQLINRWHVEQYAYLLRKLHGMKEGERTVLDNSMILFGAGLARRQQARSAQSAARAGGPRRRADRHGTASGYDEDTPLANL